MTTRLFITVGLFLLLSFLGCVKDPLLPNVAPCLEDKDFVNGQSYDYVYGPPFNFGPIFNLVNSGQYIYVNRHENHFSLMMGDLHSEAKEVLLDSIFISGRIKLNGSGKAVYSDYSGCLNIFDLNKRQNMIVTSSGFFHYADWLNDTTLLCRYSSDGGNPYFWCKVDLNGDILEKVDGSSFAHGAINRKNGLVATADRGGGSNIWLYTIDGVLVRKLTHHKFNGDNRIMDIQWLNDKEILFTMSNYGLMNLHIETKKVATLIQGCNQNSYQFFSVSPDGREILIDRRDVKYIDPDPDRPTSIKYESKIYRYNVGSRRIYRVTEF